MAWFTAHRRHRAQTEGNTMDGRGNCKEMREKSRCVAEAGCGQQGRGHAARAHAPGAVSAGLSQTARRMVAGVGLPGRQGRPERARMSITGISGVLHPGRRQKGLQTHQEGREKPQCRSCTGAEEMAAEGSSVSQQCIAAHRGQPWRWHRAGAGVGFLGCRHAQVCSFPFVSGACASFHGDV